MHMLCFVNKEHNLWSCICFALFFFFGGIIVSFYFVRKPRWAPLLGIGRAETNRKDKDWDKAQCSNLRVTQQEGESQVGEWANGQKSPPPPYEVLFIGRRRWSFMVIPLVRLNITTRSLRFTNESLEVTNRSLDAATKSLYLINWLLDPLTLPLLHKGLTSLRWLPRAHPQHSLYQSICCRWLLNTSLIARLIIQNFL